MLGMNDEAPCVEELSMLMEELRNNIQRVGHSKETLQDALSKRHVDRTPRSTTTLDFVQNVAQLNAFLDHQLEPRIQKLLGDFKDKPQMPPTLSSPSAQKTSIEGSNGVQGLIPGHNVDKKRLSTLQLTGFQFPLGPRLSVCSTESEQQRTPRLNPPLRAEPLHSARQRKRVSQYTPVEFEDDMYAAPHMHRLSTDMMRPVVTHIPKGSPRVRRLPVSTVELPTNSSRSISSTSDCDKVEYSITSADTTEAAVSVSKYSDMHPVTRADGGRNSAGHLVIQGMRQILSNIPTEDPVRRAEALETMAQDIRKQEKADLKPCPDDSAASPKEKQDSSLAPWPLLAAPYHVHSARAMVGFSRSSIVGVSSIGIRTSKSDLTIHESRRVSQPQGAVHSRRFSDACSGSGGGLRGGGQHHVQYNMQQELSPEDRRIIPR
jgi:hypothetical protein